MSLPGVCVVCRSPVRWSSGAWRQPGSRGHVHRCAEDRKVCGAWMPLAQEHCARTNGHGPEKGYPGHRTRYALDNALFMATGRRAS
jgi:hypothetical protein